MASDKYDATGRVVAYIESMLEEEVIIPDLADRAFYFVRNDPELEEQFLEEQIDSMVYVLTRDTVGKGRKRKEGLALKPRTHKRDELIARYKEEGKSFFDNWYEQHKDGHVLFRHMTRESGLSAAEIRAKRATREGEHAVAIHDQVVGLRGGENIGEEKPDETILDEMALSAERTLDMTFRSVNMMIERAKGEE